MSLKIFDSCVLMTFENFDRSQCVRQLDQLWYKKKKQRRQILWSFLSHYKEVSHSISQIAKKYTELLFEPTISRLRILLKQIHTTYEALFLRTSLLKVWPPWSTDFDLINGNMKRIFFVWIVLFLFQFFNF